MKNTVSENYYNMEAKIRSLGSIKDIVNNPYAVKSIIAYDGDRHFLCAFIEAVNEGMKNGTLEENDLQFFRSGEFADSIVHLKETIDEVNPHELQQAERLDKINYMSLLKDPKTLAVSYTHPEIISALCGESMDPYSDELTWWSRSGTYSSLPGNVQMTIVSEVLKRGNLEAAQNLVSQATYGVTAYPSNEEIKR